MISTVTGLLLILAGATLLWMTAARGPAGMHQEAPWLELNGFLVGLSSVIAGILIVLGFPQ